MRHCPCPGRVPASSSQGHWSLGSDALRRAQEPPSMGPRPFHAYKRGFSSNVTILLQGSCAGPQSSSVNMTDPSLQESLASEEEEP